MFREKLSEEHILNNKSISCFPEVEFENSLDDNPFLYMGFCIKASLSFQD